MDPISAFAKNPGALVQLSRKILARLNFNERWFQGWGATPEEQRIKFINIADGIKAHPDFQEKYQNNPDVHTRILAFEKIFEDVILKNRRNELELYKLLANDPAFKAAMQQS